MLPELPFHLAISQARAKDPRYHPQAYEFVREALNLAVKTFREGKNDQHVTGQEVLEGVRIYALAEYGPLAYFILKSWGITAGDDVGNIVYNLIDTGYFGKNDEDSLADFSGGFDFKEALEGPHRAAAKTAHPQEPSAPPSTSTGTPPASQTP